MADGVRVLYVDDEQDLLDIGKVFLERSGDFHVGTFSSALEALDSPSIQSWDLIVSDYQMPDMNGIEFLKAVRFRFGDLPFILFTGRGREEVVIDAINNGADFYLQKGGDPRAQFAELAHKIRQSIRRRQAERSLHDSERRLSDIIDFLPDATFAIDRAGTLIAWNRAIEELSGIPARDMVGKGDHEYSLPFYGQRRPTLIDLLDEQAETTSQFYSNFSRAGTTLTGETTFSDRNGNQVSVLIKACPLHDQNGDITGAIESIRDITGRKQAEETITRSKEYLDQIFSSVQAGIVVIDALTHEIVDINPAGAAMIGLPKDRIVNTICHKHICPAETGRCPITDLHKTVDNSERVLLTGTGEELSIIKNVTRTMLDGRECLVETFIDNTSRRQAEDSLRESEAKYRELAELLPQMVFEMDLNLQVTYANQYALTTMGLTEPDLKDGINALSFFDPSQYALVTDNMQKALKRMIFEPREYITLRRDGSRFPVIVYPAPVYQDGTLTGLRGVIVDISEQRKNEEELRENASKFRSIFENSPYPIAINSLPESTFLEVNRAFLNVSGYTEAEVLGKNPMELGMVPVIEAVKLIAHRIRAGKLENVPMVITVKEGRRVHVLFSTIPITIDKKPAIVTVTAEYTRLKQIEEQLLQKNEELNTAYEDLTATEEELRQSFEELSKNQEVLCTSEEKYRTLVDLSLDGILIIDFSGNLLFANPAAGNIIDVADYQAMIGTRNVIEFVAPESQAEVLRDLSQVARGIDAYLVQYKLITEEKREVWVDCIGKKVSFRDTPAILISMRDITESKRAETILRESENKFATVFKNSPLPLTLVSIIEGVFVDINDAFLRSTGYSRDEIIGKTAEEMGLFVDMSEYGRFVSTLREQRTVIGMELKCRGKSGEIGICRFSSSIILMNRRPFILSTVDDVTERKSTERAVQALVRSMVDTTGLDALKKIGENVSSWLGAECVMIGEIQPDGETVKVVSMILDGEEVQGFTYKLKGTPCENVVEKGFCLYPDDAIRLFPESRDLVDLNIRGYLGTPLRNSKGRVSGVLCALSRSPLTPSPTVQEIMDIIAVKASAEIERLQMDRMLRESKHMLTVAMDLTNLVDWEYDAGTDQFILNERFYAMYATSAEREGGYRISLDTYIREFVHPEDRDAVAAVFFNSLPSNDRDLPDTEVKLQIEHRIVRRDGEVRHIMVRTRFMKDAGTERIRFLGANQDITDRKRAEEALQQANRKLNMLSGITRHDIRNQLLKLDGFVELLQCDAPDPSLENYFSHITAASNQVANLIQFTSEYEKIGVQSPTWQDIRVQVDQAGMDAGPGSVTLINDLPADTAVYADPMIVRIFFNLVDNALRHGGAITTIRFSLEERDGDQVIVCEDDGDGVATEEKEKIFDLGYGKNTGFGLSISREILDITGITINETGEAGKGARFEITVPAGQYRSTSYQ